MSVRAHGIRIDYTKPNSTFGLWQNNDFMDVIKSVGCYYSNSNGDIGLITISEFELEQIIEHLQETGKIDTKENRELISTIKKNVGNDITHYICF